MKHNVLSEEPLSLVEVKSSLEKMKKTFGELNFRAQKTYDHLQSVAVLSLKKSQDLEKKITELNIPRMRDVHVKKLVDTLPTTEKDAKVILSGFNVTFTGEHLKAIVTLTKEYAQS